MNRLALLALVAAGCSSSAPDPCVGVPGTCRGVPAGSTAEEAQQVLIDVQPGETIAFGSGTYDFRSDLSLTVDNVTIVGKGMAETILSFKNQTEGAQGLLVTANGFAISDLAIEDTPGDALKVLGGQGVTIQSTRVEWTRGPDGNNGGYGIYPVQCQDVLLDGNVVKGASDSGVYVGQSNNIIVQNNDVELNVAGIEIENSSQADVHDNTATQNTGGILVFNLPDLQVKNGSNTRVFDNMVFENNTENFAKSGNIVGLVPAGTGIAMLAAHHVEVFNNIVHDHDSVNVGIISYVPTGNPVTDAAYDEFPTALYIHDNDLAGTSAMPSGPLGVLLIAALQEIQPSGPYIVPDVAWDGVLDPARVQSGTGDYTDDDKICLQNNGDADFINLEWPLGDATTPETDMTPHDCSHAALPAVVLP